MPIAVIQSATRSDQRSIVTTLQQLVADIQVSGIGSPAIMIVGETVRYANAGAYEAQKTVTIDNPNSWESVDQVTAARMQLDGLTPGKTYWARLRAIGSAGPGAWSEPVSAIAL